MQYLQHEYLIKVKKWVEFLRNINSGLKCAAKTMKGVVTERTMIVIGHMTS